MPRWEYIFSEHGGGSPAASRQRGAGGRLPLLQAPRTSSSNYLGQRGFNSPRTAMRYEEYLSDASSPVLPGYIPPGTHAIPTASSSSSRRLYTATPRPTTTSTSLGGCYHHPRSRYAGKVVGLRGPHQQQQHVTPLFPLDDEEASFFPPDTLPTVNECFWEPFSQEKFAERLASFPEVPLDAHRRIFQMGNEIVDCFEVRLERFYRGSLLDSVSDCVAVFTKKERTGQRWLMVFKEDITRTIVKFNRLLTHSLLVSVVSSTAIEIEAAKSIFHYPPAEMCVINFMSKEDAARFFTTLQESQATTWNHREVTHEQKMKNLFSKINVVLAQEEYNGGVLHGAASPSIMSSSGSGNSGSAGNYGLEPTARTPFTLLNREREQQQQQQQQRRAGRASPSSYPGSAGTIDSPAADMDNDWRKAGCGRGDEQLSSFLSYSPLSSRLRKSVGAYSSKSGERGAEDGSGDGFCGKIEKNLNSAPKETEERHQRRGNVVFEVTVTLFTKIDSEYSEVGAGRLQLVDHDCSALNEIRLISTTDDKETLQMYIYKWNSAEKCKEERTRSCLCLWDGAATFSVEAETCVPERREFRVRLTSEDEADEFIQYFKKSVEKAKDEGIRKRHISWYLTNRKKEYKIIPQNSSI